MRNDNIFSTGTETQIFNVICGIYYMGTINNSKCLKTKKDQIRKIKMNENE